MTKIIEIISKEKFKEQCENSIQLILYEKNEPIEKILPQFSPTQFKEWLDKSLIKYHANYSIVLSYIDKIRQKYDFKFSNCDQEDPISYSPYCDIIHEYKEIYHHLYEQFMENELIQYKIKELSAFREQELREENLHISVNEIQFKAIDMCDVLWSGWEADYYAWVVEYEGKRKLVTSDHGHKYFSDKDFLINKIKEYEKAIEDSKRLISLLDV